MTETYRTIGRRLRRPDAGPRLTGSERYTADIALPGMLHACLVPSTEARARIHSIDTAAARNTESVVAVLTAADLPEHARDDEPVDRGLFFLAGERVAYAG